MKKGLRVLLIAAAIVALFGCAGLRGTLSLGSGTGTSKDSASKQVSSSQIGPLDNNSTVQLEAGRYQGNIEISANKVVLKGRGAGATKIAGDVRISGNSCTLTGLTIAGNVYLNGNNNSISRVNVTGKVISKGNNNSW